MKIVKIVYLSALLLFTNQLMCQIKQVDGHPNDAIKTIVDQLITGVNSDSLKALNIYKWICSHIYYDYERYDQVMESMKYIGPRSAIQTIRMQKGICQDYSKLVKEMFSYTTIRCEEISGYAKAKNELLIEFDSSRGATFHSWNAVMVGNSWKLMDCTWGSILSSEGSMPYFFTPSEEFILTHFPRNDKWQLIERKLSFDQFLALPIYRNLDVAVDEHKLLQQKSCLGVLNNTIELDNFFAEDVKLAFKVIEVETGDEVDRDFVNLVRPQNKLTMDLAPMSHLMISNKMYWLSIGKNVTIGDNLTEFIDLVTYYFKYP